MRLKVVDQECYNTGVKQINKRVEIVTVDLTINDLMNMIVDNGYDKYTYVDDGYPQNARYWFITVLEYLLWSGKIQDGGFEAINALRSVWKSQNDEIAAVQIAEPLQGIFYARDINRTLQMSGSAHPGGGNVV
ncbi:hypothetical protein BO94DRAFT_588331 [Aspergillus sclerotioniger CBS 115572]|uniref:DUF7770 domain-containing protein n=1 Tax=Aspergillus sclerotioniger CBS 115572 TaxID=1450535 RepID=A0A317VYM9_9EURO|nr:hypothetical protein BO94DRAFT_588331 [Aspergillus sclerotioniger CBS 115572]PWY78028.1 hypothetical protein BO94DRAFT_588331 [Aspergillus sclerotioniger CBS 115572]